MFGLLRAVLPVLALFGSFSTLLCCALPALLVSLGGAAVLIGLVSAVPQLIWISAHKRWLFAFAGTMLAISAASRWAVRHEACPADPEQAAACGRLKRMSGWVFCCSLGLYSIGFFFAFVAPYI